MILVPRSQLGKALPALLISIVAITSAACGDSTDESIPASESVQVDETAINVIGDRPEISAWTRPNSDFSYDDFIDVGWKQHEIYEVDTLPEALEARYGFFKRRDVEIRRYPSHDQAMNAGVNSAQEAIERVVHDGSGFASRRVYGGFLVVGNLVMMCEVSTDDCIALIEAAETTSTAQ